MSFEITTHESIPPIGKTGLTAILRKLDVLQSVHVPADGDPLRRQGARLRGICNGLRKCTITTKYSVRMRPDRSFDIYRIE